jgi:hypothetical protein
MVQNGSERLRTAHDRPFILTANYQLILIFTHKF